MRSMKRFAAALVFVFGVAIVAGGPNVVAFLLGGPVAMLVSAPITFLVTMASLLAFDLDTLWERLSNGPLEGHDGSSSPNGMNTKTSSRGFARRGTGE
jgi:hypothetical protein